jgi:hypothetical protein
MKRVAWVATAAPLFVCAFSLASFGNMPYAFRGGCAGS